jgi:hypothetical protein
MATDVMLFWGGMRTFIVVLVAYLITDAHFVWRDVTTDVIRRPSFARDATLPSLTLRVLTWLPFVLPLPWVVGWHWRSLKQYAFSVLLFVALALAGMLIAN